MKVLVLGIGNVLMGDEGVGVHAIRYLQTKPLPKSVELLDGGTGGFHLLSLFEQYNPLVIIDATMDGTSPGTIRVIEPRFASDFPRTLSAHDIGLRDMVEAANLLGHLPKIFLIIVSIEKIQPMSDTLSAEIQSTMESIGKSVDSILKNITMN